jgi:hypothetical protein
MASTAIPSQPGFVGLLRETIDAICYDSFIAADRLRLRADATAMLVRG